MSDRKRHTLIIGHRGAYDLAPENTLKGFRKAIELGVDYIEFDVHQTIDGALVIIHNNDILRRMGINSLIEQMSLHELKKIDIGEGERIPELSELLELAKGKTKFFCEIKAPGISEEVINLLRKEGLINSTIISSFNINELLNFRNIESSIELVSIVPENDEYLPEWEDRKQIIDNVIKLGFKSIATQQKNLDRLFFTYCKEHQLKVYVYPLNTKISMKQFISMGVDGIIVNSIKKAKKAFDQIFLN